jgi:tRNA(Arg) A34 adenosine deaminase TadA
MELAIEAAKTSSCRYRVGAVLVDKKGHLLSLGVNSVRTSHLQRHYAAKVGRSERTHEHAEISAIRSMPAGAEPAMIYLARVGKRGTSLPIHPCPICSTALAEYGVKVYAA